MKKYLLIFCFLFVGHSALSQVSEIMQQTWYLRSIVIDNVWYYLPYGETIQLNFTGDDPNYTITTHGIENTLTANAVFTNQKIKISDVQLSSDQCTEPNCDYENRYFYEFLSNRNLEDKIFDYQYFNYSNSPKLFRLKDYNGNRADFSDSPLPVIDQTLFQEWHLHSMDVDLGHPRFIRNYEPPIFPTLTINPDLTFTGYGSCNDFSGRFDYTEYNSDLMLIPKDFVVSTNTCQFHNDFEMEYFQNFSYNATLYFYVWTDPNNGYSTFSFEMYAGYLFNFGNYPVLSTSDLKKKASPIYPNPVNDILFINSEEKAISLIVTDINGRIVKLLENSVSKHIDVSNLESGMYFLIIKSSQERLTKKFIKN